MQPPSWKGFKGKNWLAMRDSYSSAWKNLSLGISAYSPRLRKQNFYHSTFKILFSSVAGSIHNFSEEDDEGRCMFSCISNVNVYGLPAVTILLLMLCKDATQGASAEWTSLLNYWLTRGVVY